MVLALALQGLCRLLTNAKTFEDAMDLCISGDYNKVDMLVQDIYGGGSANLPFNPMRQISSARLSAQPLNSFVCVPSANSPRSLQPCFLAHCAACRRTR
jgi:hypothetical protein